MISGLYITTILSILRFLLHKQFWIPFRLYAGEETRKTAADWEVEERAGHLEAIGELRKHPKQQTAHVVVLRFFHNCLVLSPEVPF